MVSLNMLKGLVALASLGVGLSVRDPLSEIPSVKFRRVRVSSKPPNLRLDSSAHIASLRKIQNSKETPRTGADLALGIAQRSTGDGFGYTNVTIANRWGTSFAIDVIFNNYSIPLIVDSGSADTWAVSSEFACVDWLGIEYDQELCGFGTPFPGKFVESIENKHFFIQYGSGEQISGPLGKLDVTVAGIKVENAEVALANLTYWHGNNYTVGLMGLAYPSLTSAYYGNDPSLNSEFNMLNYNPLFTEMVNQGLLDMPLWSIAIQRNSSDGIIAFGGIPIFPDIWSAPSSWTDIIVVCYTSPLDKQQL